VAAGVWLTARAAGIIDPLQLAGIRQVLGNTPADRFQVVGPYHLVRHPIYLGWTVIVFGIPDMTWTRFAFAAISSAYLIVAIPFEERSLVETFGPAYVEYQRTVRWRIVPGVW
jgi:methanethiol S-methyltransferase